MKHLWTLNCMGLGVLLLTHYGFAQRASEWRLEETSVTSLSNWYLNQTTLGRAAVPLPMRTSAAYGSWSVESKSPPYAPALTRGNSLPACGPLPVANAMACYHMWDGSLLDVIPLPGNLTTRPVLFDNNWLVGTSRGVLLRFQNSSTRGTPSIQSQDLEFWSPSARKRIKALKKDVSLKASTTSWKWVHVGSSEFIGTPLIQNNIVYTLSANQFLQAFDWNTGKLLWANRLSNESNLHLTSLALAASQSEILAGTQDGQLQSFDPKTGTLRWQHTLSSDKVQQFRAITAPPLIVGKSAVVSNVEAITQRIHLGSQNVQWSYAEGSMVTAVPAHNQILVGSSKGALIALDETTGHEQWKRQLFLKPIVAMQIVNEQLILVAAQDGQIALVNLADNKTLFKTTPYGNVAGQNFILSSFTGRTESAYKTQEHALENAESSQACLSFVDSTLRCFKVYKTKNGIYGEN